jgi:hypothetical protein
MEFPKISEVCNDIHIDFTDDTPTSYGLSPVGDVLLSEDVLGNQKRQHSFILYAVYQSANDFDRLANSSALLDLQMWLEQYACGQDVTGVGGEKIGELTKLTCANGMLYAVPDGNLNMSVQYQLQIQAFYTIGGN